MSYILNKITSDYLLNKDYVSRSMLMDLNKSPAHFFFKNLSGIDQESYYTPPMIFGSALHTYVLEPELFLDRYALFENIDRRTKEGKLDYAKFVEKARGKIVIDLGEFEDILSISNNIETHDTASLLIGGAVCEKELYWVDEETGVRCKCKPDIINGTVVADLKTANDISLRGIRNAIFKYGYAVQAAMIKEGMNANNMGEMSSFWLIVAEKNAPFTITTYKLGEDFIEFGIVEFRRLLGIYKECLEENIWPGPKSCEISFRNNKLELGA
jgi:hypothetical protein